MALQILFSRDDVSYLELRRIQDNAVLQVTLKMPTHETAIQVSVDEATLIAKTILDMVRVMQIHAAIP